MKLYGDTVPSPQHKQAAPVTEHEGRLRWMPIDMPPEAERGLPLDASDYLRDRGFDPGWLVRELGFGWWPGLDRIVIPYFDTTGEIIFIAAHSHLGERPKYLYPKGPKPLYVPRHRSLGKIVIVEGQLDAAMVLAAGHMAVAIGGSYLAPHVEPDLLDIIKERPREVIIMLDGDALGAAAKLYRRLHDLGVYARIKVLPRDSDPASLGAERLKEIL